MGGPSYVKDGHWAGGWESGAKPVLTCLRFCIGSGRKFAALCAANFLKPRWFLQTKRRARGVATCPICVSPLVSGKQSTIAIKGFLQNSPGRRNLTVDKSGGNASGLCYGFGVQHGASCETFLGSFGVALLCPMAFFQNHIRAKFPDAFQGFGQGALQQGILADLLQ